MTVFADSSAVVKLYADEAGHEEMRSLGPVAVAQLARVEVPSAFWRKCRLGELAAEHAQVLAGAFEEDFYGTDQEVPRFAVIATTVSILDDAARLCAVHGLGAYDAVQLAAALAVRQADPQCSSMAAFDMSLRVAAAAEGLERARRVLALQSLDADWVGGRRCRCGGRRCGCGGLGRHEGLVPLVE